MRQRRRTPAGHGGNATGQPSPGSEGANGSALPATMPEPRQHRPQCQPSRRQLLACAAGMALLPAMLPLRAVHGAPVRLLSPAAGLNGIDFANLLELALMVDDAYRRGMRVSGYLLRQSPGDNLPENLRRLHFVVHADAEHRRQIVAIRGTIDSLDTRLDLSMRGEPDAASGAIVHRGFATLAQALYRPLLPLLKMDHELILTGHSLGGAVAALLGYRLSLEGFEVSRIVTFGQPRFTNRAGAAVFRQLPLLRVVHQRDPIAAVPARMPGDMAEHRGQDSMYAHFNDALMLLDGPYYTVQPATAGDDRSLLRRLLQGIPADHELDAYIASLREKRRQPRFIPWAQRRRHMSPPADDGRTPPRKHDVQTNFNRH